MDSQKEYNTQAIKDILSIMSGVDGGFNIDRARFVYASVITSRDSEGVTDGMRVITTIHSTDNKSALASLVLNDVMNLCCACVEDAVENGVNRATATESIISLLTIELVPQIIESIKIHVGHAAEAQSGIDDLLSGTGVGDEE